ncbi:MAG: hypothetical protein QOC86_1840, partial [Gaiellales bacterium]|nr:hypothetical protein [Gaiellales bacterium]
IAVDPSGPAPGGRIYVAYAKLDFPPPGCGGAPDSSQIQLAYTDNEGISWVTRRVSPLATSGAAHYRSPDVAVLPGGRVAVAFRNDGALTPQIETETCAMSPSPPATDYCGGPSAGLVGASTVVGPASAPGVVSGIAGAPAPSVIAAGGRVTVAWHAGAANGVRAFAAMSTDGAATFGSPQQIDPAGAGNQVAPALAATADGRVDVAYLWDPAGTGSVSATAASAGPPLPNATSEAWGTPVVVQGTPATGSLGRRLGIATDTGASPLPATVVAFTDTASGPHIHVVGLLHGTTTPVIDASQTVTASKNVTTIVHVPATDADGDPLTWSTGVQPADPLSHVTMADAARGEFSYKASNVPRMDTFEAVATDGAGNQARAMIAVNVVNDPPRITCSLLFTRKDTPLPVLASDCVSDPNGDGVSITGLSNPVGGTVEKQAGVWQFVPERGSTAPGSFTLEAQDDPGLKASQVVLVTVLSPTGKVTLNVTEAGRTRSIASGMALHMKGSATDATGAPVPIFWDFGDKTAKVKGKSVTHRFRKPGTFIVKAKAENQSKQIKVIVRRRAVELVGAPRIVDGILQVTVHTRAAGKLLFRADSRSQTLHVPAGLTQRTLRIQVTTGPLVRLTLLLTPRGKAPLLRVFRLRRLVLASPVSGG